MRPPSIRMFDYLFLGSLALGMLNYFMSADQIEQQLATDSAAAELGSGFMVGVIVFSVAISFLLWFLISRKASNVAKWILIVFTVVGLVSLPASLGGMPASMMTLTLATTGLQLAALFFLFRPDAKAYFAGERPVDPQTFE